MKSLKLRPLSPYLIYIVAISILLGVGVSRIDSAERAYHALDPGELVNYENPLFFTLLILVIYLIRLFAPYLLGRHVSVRRENDQRAQALWRGAVISSVIPEIVIVIISFNMLSVSAGECTDEFGDPCGPLLTSALVVIVIVAASVIELFGVIAGYLYSVFRQRGVIVD